MFFFVFLITIGGIKSYYEISTSATRDRIYKSNKDENAHRFTLSTIRGEILERERNNKQN